MKSFRGVVKKNSNTKRKATVAFVSHPLPQKNTEHSHSRRFLSQGKQSNAKINLLREEVRGQRPCIIEGFFTNVLAADTYLLMEI